MEAFEKLDPHFEWDAAGRGDILREIALMAAVEMRPEGLEYLRKVPGDHRTGQLFEWQARLGMHLGDWQAVLDAIGAMAPETASDARWRYWRARAGQELGYAEAAQDGFEELAGEASFYGFLAADHLQLPYTICPREPSVPSERIGALREMPGISRALELRRAGLDGWAIAEWSMVMRRLPVRDLKAAAALAVEQGWHDRAIFALGDSGDMRLYEWRFPLSWEQPVMAAASRHHLDPAWVLGIIRSESAMTETARSSAGALGLMQVTPSTARALARRHGLAYRRKAQLLDGEQNIRFGTAYLRELLDEYAQNPVLALGAYNAGPRAVDRWLKSRSVNEMLIWMETLPYFETRDYIPRVLAFSTIYDWRLENPVRRISSRIPGIGSGKIGGAETTRVVCRTPTRDLAAAGR